MSDNGTILVICQQNRGRSQIVEAYLNKFYGDQFAIESAGLEPANTVNTLVVKVITEERIDISGKKPQSVFEFFKHCKLYAHVISVCQDSETKCPILPGITKRWHWPFPNPALVEGTEAEKPGETGRIRDMIKDWRLNPTETTFDIKKLIPKLRHDLTFSGAYLSPATPTKGKSWQTAGAKLSDAR